MRAEIIWLILGMSLVTALPRILPVIVLSRFNFPEKLREWLSYIAPAVLGALLAVSVLAPKGELSLTLTNHYLWVFIPTILVAVFSKNLFYTLIIGIVLMALCNHFIIF